MAFSVKYAKVMSNIILIHISLKKVGVMIIYLEACLLKLNINLVKDRINLAIKNLFDFSGQIRLCSTHLFLSIERKYWQINGYGKSFQEKALEKSTSRGETVSKT